MPIQHTFDLGNDHTATVTYRVLLPREPPQIGSEWPAETDHPYVEVTITLPADYHHKQLISELCNIPVLGEVTTLEWGGYRSGTRIRSITRSTPSVATMYEELTGEVNVAIASLRQAVSDRAARLAEREQTIARALESAPAELLEVEDDLLY